MTLFLSHRRGHLAHSTGVRSSVESWEMMESHELQPFPSLRNSNLKDYSLSETYEYSEEEYSSYYASSKLSASSEENSGVSSYYTYSSRSEGSGSEVVEQGRDCGITDSYYSTDG